MNGIDYIADTNAIIYLLSGNLCMKPYISNRPLITADKSFRQISGLNLILIEPVLL